MLITPPLDYRNRELEASNSIKEKLAALREQAIARKWTFEVGYTDAMDLAIEKLKGLKPPSNWLDQAELQNSQARPVQGQRLRSLSKCVANASRFNWADHNCVTPVRSQGFCADSWAFATHAAFEASYAILNGELIDSSEQDTIDCSGSGDCNGGFWAFQHLIDTGSAKEADYPYAAKKEACKTEVQRPYRAVSWGYVDSAVPIPSVAALKKALCEYGPLAVGVAVTPAFQAYTGGVFNEGSNEEANHPITLVGWDDSKQAWRVKNNWGTVWGESGYMWIAYNSNQIGYAASWVQAKPVHACKNAPSLIASSSINWSDNKQFSSNANMLSATFNLPEEMHVIIMADASAFIARGTAPQAFTTGLCSDPATGVMWTGSLRKGSFLAANQHIPVRFTFAMKLVAGAYTCYWKIWLGGYTIGFDSGVLTVLAVPCSMGGNLQKDLAAPKEIGKALTQADTTIMCV